ncbi:MAG TPA: hypothetical protein VM328_08025, partial [Fimbriimonadaceae bacterium]|nr:hypothetical protein [Fimbriimonadaceae bacterium]
MAFDVGATILGGLIAGGAGATIQVVSHVLTMRRDRQQLAERRQEALRADQRRWDESVAQQRLEAYAELAAWVLTLERHGLIARTMEGEDLHLPTKTFARVHVLGTGPVRAAMDKVARAALKSAASGRRWRIAQNPARMRAGEMLLPPMTQEEAGARPASSCVIGGRSIS